MNWFVCWGCYTDWRRAETIHNNELGKLFPCWSEIYIQTLVYTCGEGEDRKSYKKPNRRNYFVTVFFVTIFSTVFIRLIPPFFQWCCVLGAIMTSHTSTGSLFTLGGHRSLFFKQEKSNRRSLISLKQSFAQALVIGMPLDSLFSLACQLTYDSFGNENCKLFHLLHWQMNMIQMEICTQNKMKGVWLKRMHRKLQQTVAALKWKWNLKNKLATWTNNLPCRK